MAADAVTGEMAPPQGGEPFHETSEIVGGCSGGAGATENDFVMPDIVPVQNEFKRYKDLKMDIAKLEQIQKFMTK